MTVKPGRPGACRVAASSRVRNATAAMPGIGGISVPGSIARASLRSTIVNVVPSGKLELRTACRIATGAIAEIALYFFAKPARSSVTRTVSAS